MADAHGTSLIIFVLARVSRSPSDEQEPDGSPRRARRRTFGSITVGTVLCSLERPSARASILFRWFASRRTPRSRARTPTCPASLRVGSKCWSLHRSLKPRDVGSIPTQPTKSLRTRHRRRRRLDNQGLLGDRQAGERVAVGTPVRHTGTSGFDSPHLLHASTSLELPQLGLFVERRTVPRERASPRSTSLDRPSSCSWTDGASNARATHMRTWPTGSGTWLPPSPSEFDSRGPHLK